MASPRAARQAQIDVETSSTTWYDLAHLENIMRAAGICLHSLLLPQDWDGMFRAELVNRACASGNPIKRSFSQMTALSDAPSSHPESADMGSSGSGGADVAPPMSLSGGSMSSETQMDEAFVARACSVSVAPTERSDLSTRSPYSERSVMQVLWPKNDLQVVACPPDPAMQEANRLEHFKSMTHDELAANALRQAGQLANKENQLQSAKKKLKGDKQRLRRLQLAHNKLNEKVSQLKHPEMEDLAVYRGTERKLSWRGSISLGLRKAMATASATSFPHASLLDISRNTVVRCEVLVDAYLLSRSVMFHRMVAALLYIVASWQLWQEERAQKQQKVDCRALVVCEAASDTAPDLLSSKLVANDQNDSGNGDEQMEARFSTHDAAVCKDLGLPNVTGEGCDGARALLSQFPHGKPFCLGATFFSGDATNSSIWQRQKLQGLLTTSALMVDWKQLEACCYEKALKRMKSMSLGLMFDLSS